MFLCAIAKNEAPYIEEWVSYHLALGVKHIFLYDNEDSPTLNNISCLDPYRASLTVCHFPGFAKQFEAYNHCLSLSETHSYRWGGFIDIDEFIVLKKHENLIDFMTEHCPAGVLSINWVVFSGNAAPNIDIDVNDINIPVTKRFLMRREKADKQVKCLFNRDCVHQIHNPHYPWTFDVKKYVFNHNGLNSEIKKTGKLPWPYEIHLKNPATCNIDAYPLLQYDTSGRCTYGPFNENSPTDIAQINHYYFKSKEEYSKKYKSFGSDGAQKNAVWNCDNDHIIYEPNACDFYTNHVSSRENIRKGGELINIEIKKEEKKGEKEKELLKLYIVAHDFASEEQAKKLVIEHYPFGEVLLLPDGETSPYFESDVFRVLHKRGFDQDIDTYEYIGIITYSFVKKMGPINLLKEVREAHTESDPDVISLLNLDFFKPRVNRTASFIESISMQHGPFMWNIIQSFFDQNPKILDKSIQGFFSNWFVVKPTWLKKYTEFYIQCRERLEKDPLLRSWVQEDSYYIGSKTMTDSQLIKIFGKPQYGLQPFIFERIPAIFFHLQGAKVIRSKNPKPIQWNLYD